MTDDEEGDGSRRGADAFSEGLLVILVLFGLVVLVLLATFKFGWP